MAKDNETRKQIMAAAARLFGERSFMRVSIRDIAVEVGVTPASLYYYFDSKEEILEEIIQNYDRVNHRFATRLLAHTSQPDYRPSLSHIICSYEPDESELMFWSTRIIYMEQFNFPNAANALMGDSYKRFKKGYQSFFKAMADHGFIQNRRNIPDYCDFLYRVIRSYQLDFLHPELMDIDFDKLKNAHMRVIKMILLTEGTVDRYRELLR